MQFLNPTRALVNTPIYSCSYGQCTADDGAYACKETCECFGAFFSVDYFHWRDIVAEEGTWYAASKGPVSNDS